MVDTQDLVQPVLGSEVKSFSGKETDSKISVSEFKADQITFIRVSMQESLVLIMTDIR